MNPLPAPMRECLVCVIGLEPHWVHAFRSRNGGYLVDYHGEALDDCNILGWSEVPSTAPNKAIVVRVMVDGFDERRLLKELSGIVADAASRIDSGQTLESIQGFCAAETGSSRTVELRNVTREQWEAELAAWHGRLG